MKSIKRMGLLGAFVAVAAALGVGAVGMRVPTASAQTPAGLTVAKSCTAATVNIGASVTCTVTITAAAAVSVPEVTAPPVAGVPTAIVVNVRPGNGITGAGGFGHVRLLQGLTGATGTDVDSVQIANVTGSVQGVFIGCTGTTCDFAAGDVFTITLAESGAVGGATTEDIQFGTGAAAPFVLGTPVSLTPTVTVNPATTIIQTNLGGAAGSVVVCTPNSVVNVGSGAAGAVTCELDFDDNDALDPDSVSSGNVTLTITGPTGTSISSPGFINISPTAIQGRCGVANAPQGCSRLPFTITSATGSTVTGPVSVSVQYTPDLPAVNTPLTQTIANAVNVIQPVAAFIAPLSLTITCGTPAAITFSPGPLSAAPGTPIQIGILPTALQCEVRTQTDADADAEAVASGTIEVSSINGALLDANGRITTNLRIACGDPTVITLNLGPAIDPNICTGVRFAVAGLNVGQVELRARYEPSNAAAQAGVAEREVAASVFFVAPNPCAGTFGCSLLLNPNPVAVGQTGTATLRFGREFLSCGGVIICVDPTTGAPIVVNQGSILNGQVVFTIADSVIASWVAAQPTATTPVPSSTAGFVTTANQTIVRCGFFPTTTLPSGAVSTPFIGGAQPLTQFFGGCESAVATYRGNNPGLTAVNATFIPDLPGATGILSALTPANFPQASTFQSSRGLEVVGVAPVGDIQLARGCNNVSPTVTEAASAYAARVNPSGALVAIWEHQAATNTFRGWSPAAGAPNDLAGVTRLRPVFVCTSGAATLAQPPA